MSTTTSSSSSSAQEQQQQQQQPKFKFIPEEEDFPYEEEVIRNPYNVKSWLRYIEFKQSWFSGQSSEYMAQHPGEVRRRYLCLDITYERALRVLPGSYKLWHAYLGARVRRVQSARPQSTAVTAVISAFERSLMYMGKMPRIWLDYTAFLTTQGFITRTREVFDRALQALPISQHDIVWPQYLRFVRRDSVPVRTQAGVYHRYLMYDPSEVEEYIDVLVRGHAYGEAAIRLARAIEDPKFFSKRGKTKRQMWAELCKLLTTHPRDIPPTLNVDAIIRAGIRALRQKKNNNNSGDNEEKNKLKEDGKEEEEEKKKKNMSFAPLEQSDKYLGGSSSSGSEGGGGEGELWAQLAEYYIRLNHFEKARDVFEEALESVGTTADFSIVWDKYVAFEDQVVAQTVTLVESHTLDAEEQAEEEAALELCMARYENLLARHPLLLNSALLRQNPHNVHEWFKRVRIVAKEDTPAAVVATYTEALRTVDPLRATGKPHLLWAAFAKYYEAAGYYDQAAKVFEKGVREPFRHADDAASLWCEYIEMEIRHGHYDRAIQLCARATAKPPGSTSRRGTASASASASALSRVYKSAKLWALYADLEESFGTLQETRAVYEHMFDARIVTPQVVLNYAALLEENGYYEDSFKAYERGVALFDFPNAMPLWVAYLTKFVGRYGGRKLERARDLFEEVLRRVPPADAKVFYVMYANLEEEYGLVRHAMAIYDRATRAVADDDRYKMYLLYIARAEEFFGVMKTRDIYERAIQALPDKYVRPAALRFANLERKLGEVDRARAIYTHCAQYCNPARDPAFWDIWRDFEVHHGNDDTFREMLRVKRSVQASYNTQINPAALETIRQSTEIAAEMARSAENGSGGGNSNNNIGVAPVKRPAGSSMEQLEFQQRQAEEAEAEAAVTTTTTATQSHNDEEIDLDLGEDDGDDGESVEAAKREKSDNASFGIAQVPVPDAVFGGLREKAEEEKKQKVEKEKLGALERLKRAGKI